MGILGLAGHSEGEFKAGVVFLVVLQTRTGDSGGAANQAAYSNSDCWEVLAGAMGGGRSGRPTPSR